MSKKRERGFADWNPQRVSLSLVDAVTAVLAEYHDQLPLTIRQLFYILVTRSVIDKDENSYSRLCEKLNRARRAKLIAMDAFRDDGFMSADAPGWTSAESLIESLANAVDEFTLDR